MRIDRDFSLKPFNTFGLNVKAKLFTEVSTEDAIREVLTDNSFLYEKKFVLGGGSNILFTRDLDALCIRNNLKGIAVESDDSDSDAVVISAGGGEVWHDLVIYATGLNLGGIENLSLIPGSVGAAPIQNIGAYGVELKETFLDLEAIELETGEKRIFNLNDCRFGYRDSVFKNEFKGRYLISRVRLRLSRQPRFNTSYGAIEHELKAMNVSTLSVKSISQAVINIRRSKLPDPAVIGNCGSFFKNPEVTWDKFASLKAAHPGIVGFETTPGKVKLAAGWMIEDCGWKGKRNGNVGMHAQQALVLVNYGGATGAELYDHARLVQQSVKEKFDVHLEMEVNVL